jgi:uncharacterized protein involved in exopolysaccharide biosynthesis
MLASDVHAEASSLDLEKFLSVKYYVDLARRRFLYFLVPFLLIAPVGSAAVMWLPAIYLSEGKILVESARIPTELVRPTVTTRAGERIQLIEQRLLARDNILAVMDKFKLFSDRRSTMSTTELTDLMRQRTNIQAQEIGAARSPDKVTMSFTVGFEYESPETAMQVANEFITLILNEDVRNRTSRAGETTRFLAREVKRLQAELSVIDGQINDFRRSQAETPGAAHQAAMDRYRALVDRTNTEIAGLKAERLAKANRTSWNNPDVQAIQRKIASLESSIASPPAQQVLEREADIGLEPLIKQQAALLESLSAASEKLAAAQLGEALERDQYAERLEVLEQPTRPQQPIKPKRLKLLALVLGLAVLAGGGLAFLTEALDSTVRSRGDLARLVGTHLIVSIPVVESQRDRAWRKLRLVLTLGGLCVLAAALTTLAFYFLPTPDLVWQQFTTKLPQLLNR